MNPDATESRQPNLPRTLRDTDQPKLNPVYTSWQGSNNEGPNHPRKQPSDSSLIIEPLLSPHRLSRMPSDPVIGHLQYITDPYSIWARYRVRQIWVLPRKTDVHRQCTFFLKYEPIGTVCHHYRRQEIIPVIPVLSREHSQHHRQSPVQSFHQAITLRVVRSCPGLVSSTQEAHFLHHFILEFPTLGPNVSQRAYQTGIQHAERKHQPLPMPSYQVAGKLPSIEKNSPPLPGCTDCLSGS